MILPRSRRLSPTWSPRRGYAVALGLVAILSVLAFLVLDSTIRAQAGNASTINVSGRQRMLSQRTALQALQLATLRDDAERAQLRASVRADLTAMLTAHAALLGDVRGRTTSRFGAELTALQTVYFGLPDSLDALVQAHARRLEVILATPDAALRPDLPVVQDLLRSATGPLLDVLDAAVRIHAHESEVRIQRLQHLEAAVLAVTLLTLLLEGLLIFRPMERELARRSEQLIHDAFHDALTGLPNRALFLDRVEHVLLRRQRCPDTRYAVLFLDCDRFKVINDSLGHGVGDLLVELGRRLKECVRGLDTVARLGGDEFTVLLETLTEPGDEWVVCERITQAMTLPFHVAGHALHVTVSIGVITSEEGHASAQDIVRDADLAMYRAKALGRARTEVFTPALRARATALLNLEQDLRVAQARGELSVHYQPLVSLEDRHVLGFEALVRWTHATHGPISPGEFIPVAEESGVIVDVDRFVLRTACMQVLAWQAAFTWSPPLTLSVNVSARQLERADLVPHVAQVLRDTGFPPGQLKLELTESVLVDDAEHVRDTLVALKALGVQLHIDDFGTGYSNLSYLHRYPADAIKIDQSFIRNLHRGEGRQMVATIIAMARSLNLVVVAEGVETEEHRDVLRDLGCTRAQGYLFSRPMPVGAVAAFLEQRTALA
ncbi:putative bifunctional diguanylate cyclase/phosphodiesterase [Deinococcus yunweiensis]|uniref:putative bifunctional diguanylate cyclase/phosphodiesterase n=1 Tax=Deinococcus yunweiensis TaxID=367282 RepID=UPI00398F6816